MGVFLRGSSVVVDTITGERWEAGDRCRDCGARLSAVESVRYSLGPDCREARGAGYVLTDPVLRDERMQALLENRLDDVLPSWRVPFAWRSDVGADTEEVQSLFDPELASLFSSFEDESDGASFPSDS
jgi:hypothetical protein